MWKEVPKWSWYLVNEQGQIFNTKTNRYLVGDKNNIGYHRVTLYNNKQRKRIFVHRLVAELFLDNPNNFKEVNHIDGNKNNNSVTNLEWCDRAHNEREARRIGIKEYKPFQVTFRNGDIKQYEFTHNLLMSWVLLEELF